MAQGSCKQHPVDTTALYLRYAVSSAKMPNSLGIGNSVDISLAQNQHPSY